jgi:hypothetical protein
LRSEHFRSGRVPPFDLYRNVMAPDAGGGVAMFHSVTSARLMPRRVSKKGLPRQERERPAARRTSLLG